MPLSIRLIHQTWKRKHLPAWVLPLVDSWRSLHPAWEHLLWTDQDNRQLLQECYPWFLPTYDAYPYAIQRADAIRYFILHRYGGLYADLDYEPFERFDGVYTAGKPTFVQRRDGRPSNFLMYSGNGRGVWEAIILGLQSAHEQADYRQSNFPAAVLNTTGPGFLGRVLDAYKSREELAFFNWAEFDPYDRFEQALRSEEVRRLALRLKRGSAKGRLAGEAHNGPVELVGLLANCKGVHWRIATWLKTGPSRRKEQSRHRRRRQKEYPPMRMSSAKRWATQSITAVSPA